MNTWRTCRIDTSLSPKGIVVAVFHVGHPSNSTRAPVCVPFFPSTSTRGMLSTTGGLVFCTICWRTWSQCELSNEARYAGSVTCRFCLKISPKSLKKYLDAHPRQPERSPIRPRGEWRMPTSGVSLLLTIEKSDP
jgi:hypothetical protein